MGLKLCCLPTQVITLALLGYGSISGAQPHYTFLPQLNWR